MSDQSLLIEIRGLRNDLGALNEKMLNVRYADFKSVFLEQMRAAQKEEGRRHFNSGLDEISDISVCEHKSDCIAKMRGVVEEVTLSIEKDDFKAAAQMLDVIEARIKANPESCMDGGCTESFLETIGRIRTMLDIYFGLISRFQQSELIGFEPAVRPRTGNLMIEKAEASLAPLANAKRLMILSMLAKGQRTLSEISRNLNIKTGHLQFHINALKDAGYIHSDKRSRMYSITPRGENALLAVEEMMDRLGD